MLSLSFTALRNSVWPRNTQGTKGISHIEVTRLLMIQVPLTRSRDFHKWEEDEQVIYACENVVQMLIADPDGVDNFKDLEIPQHITESFERAAIAANVAKEDETPAEQ